MNQRGPHTAPDVDCLFAMPGAGACLQQMLQVQLKLDSVNAPRDGQLQAAAAILAQARGWAADYRLLTLGQAAHSRLKVRGHRLVADGEAQGLVGGCGEERGPLPLSAG